jgi:hypothetical protein
MGQVHWENEDFPFHTPYNTRPGTAGPLPWFSAYNAHHQRKKDNSCPSIKTLQLMDKSKCDMFVEKIMSRQKTTPAS